MLRANVDQLTYYKFEDTSGIMIIIIITIIII